MKKTKIVTSATLIILAFAFTGCGGGGESSASSLASETNVAIVSKSEPKKTVDNTNEVKIPLLNGVEATPTDSL